MDHILKSMSYSINWTKRFKEDEMSVRKQLQRTKAEKKIFSKKAKHVWL